MSWWFQFKDRIKRYVSFSGEEVKTLIIATIALGFMFSFKEWGVTEFDVAFGFKNWLLSAIIALGAVFTGMIAHKIAAAYLGFRAECKLWTYGLIIGLVLAFVTRGNFFFLAAVGTTYHHLAVHRLGFFRYGLNYWDQAKVAFVGPLANIFLAALIKIIATGSIVIPIGLAGSPLIEKAILFNLWYAIFNMLPIPPLDGTVAFYASRMWYVFVFGCILGYSFLVIGAGVYSLFATVAGGIVLITIYYVFYERYAA